MDSYKIELWLDTQIDSMVTYRDVLYKQFCKIKDNLIKNDINISDPVGFQNQFILFCYHNSTKNNRSIKQL